MNGQALLLVTMQCLYDDNQGEQYPMPFQTHVIFSMAPSTSTQWRCELCQSTGEYLALSMNTNYSWYLRYAIGKLHNDSIS